MTNALTRPIDALVNYTSAHRFIATGYPIVCAHSIPGQMAMDLAPITLAATVKRAGWMRWLHFEATCPDCGRFYAQDSTKEMSR